MQDFASAGRRPVQVIVDATALRALLPSGAATSLVLLTLGSVAFFAAGVADQSVGEFAPWFLVAAVLVGFALRAVDLENAALFIPGGLYGTARQAFGGATAKLAAAVVFTELL